jgi:hypothetical protein
MLAKKNFRSDTGCLEKTVKRRAIALALTLTGLEPGILLVDHVNATLAPDDAAVLVPPFQGAQRIAHFHRRLRCHK